MANIMTALWLTRLEAEDRASVKPHASPVLHTIIYLLGRLDREHLTQLRSYKGLQSYPSRTKDPFPVDLSTRSVGLGGSGLSGGRESLHPRTLRRARSKATDRPYRRCRNSKRKARGFHTLTRWHAGTDARYYLLALTAFPAPPRQLTAPTSAGTGSSSPGASSSTKVTSRLTL